MNWKSSFRRYTRNIGLSGRITLLYCLLLIGSILGSSLLYQRIFSSIMLNKVSSVSLQTMESISSNMGSLFESVNNYSKMVLANPDVRDLLKHPLEPEYLESQRRVEEFLESAMSSFPEISAIYLVDNHGNYYYKDKFPNQFNNFNNSAGSIWFKRAREYRGASYFILNGGDAFLNHPSQENFISNIRVINNIEDQRPIGAVIINISERLFVKAYSEIAKDYETHILLLDQYDRSVVQSTHMEPQRIEEILALAESQDSFVLDAREENLLYSYFRIPKYDWKLISMIPFDEISRESSVFMLISLATIVVIALLILLGSLVITRMITKPIHILVQSMNRFRQGEMQPVGYDSSITEYHRLKEGYNLMLEEIQILLHRVVEEENRKRKAEMDILQAQIKPHFLYNTFDSISSLSLLGRNDDVFKMINALGNYYRISLSKGREKISLKEEIDTVSNYLKILNIRYPDLFEVCYDLDHRLDDLEILKLVLQPFVENALYHGIKPKGEPGTIRIRSRIEEDRVELMIADDGVGMDRQKKEELQLSLDSMDNKSFGIAATVERLRLFYRRKDVMEWESHKGKGSRFILKLYPTDYLEKLE